MQVNTSKNILLVSLLLIIVPISLSAQIGTKKYITRSGDTTIIVNAGSTGLHGEDAKFLFDSKATEDYLDRNSRYRKLKEAADETDQVAKIVQVEKKETNPTSGSLGFRRAQQNIRYLQNDKKSTSAARENINRSVSMEELTFMKEKFGEKPSYFINGIQVDAPTAASVSEKDILTRSLKVANTTTGNPNGEVWYVVNSKAYDRLGLDNYEMIESTNNSYVTNMGRDKIGVTADVDESIFDEDIVTMPSSITHSEYQQLAPEQQQVLTTQQQEVEELKRQIEEVRRQRAAISGGIVNDYQEPVRSYQPSNNASKPSTQRTPQVEKIIGFKDSPQERTRRERDQMSETGITNDTPKRSVRRIKDRERNR